MKHTVSRLLSVLLAILLCASLLLSACNNEEEPSDVPEGCLRAENEAVDYTFCYPDTWTVDRNDGMISIKYNVGKQGTIANASVSVSAFTMENSDMLANAYWDTYKADLIDLYTEEKLNFVSEKVPTKLGGVAANRNRYDLTLSDMTYTFEQVICVRYGVVYLVTYTVPAVSYDTAADGFEKVIETFAFK